jgi:hypothetical protein
MSSREERVGVPVLATDRGVTPLRVMLAAAAGCVAAAALLQQARPGVDAVPALAIALMNMTRARVPVGRRESFGAFDNLCAQSVLAYLLQAPCNVRSLVMVVSTVPEIEQLGAMLRVLRPDHFQVRHIRFVVKIRTPEPDAVLHQLLTRPFDGLRRVRHLELHFQNAHSANGAVDAGALFAHAAQLRRLDLSFVSRAFAGEVDWSPMTRLRAIGSATPREPAPSQMRQRVYVDKNDRMTRFVMPDSVTQLELPLVKQCSALRSIHFAAALRALPAGCCAASAELTAIDLSHCRSLTRIGGNFARGCKRLASVLLPDSLASIGACFLAVCPALQECAMPAALTELGSGAFGGSGVRRIDLSRCTCSDFVHGLRAEHSDRLPGVPDLVWP